MGAVETRTSRESQRGNRLRQTDRQRERTKKDKKIVTMEARRNNVAAGHTGDPFMLLGVIAGLTALTSVVQRHAKLSQFANDFAKISDGFDFAKISDGFDNYENSRSLSWPGRLVKPGEELVKSGEEAKKGDHLFLSDRAIFARIIQVIEDSGEVEGDEKQRAERRVGEQELQTEGFSSYEVEAGVDEEEYLVDRTAEPPVGSLTCWARYGVCLTRSVFMSLRDLPNEGRVLVGLAFGAFELITTGGITEAYSDLNEVAHVRHTADCIQHFDSCS